MRKSTLTALPGAVGFADAGNLPVEDCAAIVVVESLWRDNDGIAAMGAQATLNISDVFQNESKHM